MEVTILVCIEFVVKLSRILRVVSRKLEIILWFFEFWLFGVKSDIKPSSLLLSGHVRAGTVKFGVPLPRRDTHEDGKGPPDPTATRTAQQSEHALGEHAHTQQERFYRTGRPPTSATATRHLDVSAERHPRPHELQLALEQSPFASGDA